MADFVKVAGPDEIPSGGRLVTEIDGRMIAVFHVADAYHVIDDICTHDGGPLAEGELHGCVVECPRHGARFDIRTGQAVSFPAFAPVATHRVESRADGVYVALDD